LKSNGVAHGRRRVIVIGGGIAGLTTAFELSRTAHARQEWDVEVVEMGHKLGGRLFSAHNPEAWGRNEEHGLHVWFGFYDNAFRLAEEVWSAFDKPEGCPWKTIWDALQPIHASDHGLPHADGYVIRRVIHARNADRPGEAGDLSWAGRLTHSIDLVRSLPLTLLSLLRGGGLGPGPSGALWPAPGEESLLRDAAALLAPLLRRAGLLEKDGAPERGRGRNAMRAGRMLERLHRPLVARLRAVAGDDPAGVELARVVDLVLAAARGVTSPEHGILEDGDLDRVSAWELGAWLQHHGATEDSVARANLLEFFYDAAFAYVRGDRKCRALEASTALRFTFRMFGAYKHAIAYLLRAGAGETLVAPLFSVLRARGVRFRFFHRLHRVEVDRTTKQVKRLVFVRAARVRGAYDPTVEHDGLLGFRATPDWSQLEDGDALSARGVEFYSRFAKDRGERDEVVLEAGRDFDDVVLALPLGSVLPDADGHSPVKDWLSAHPPALACLERLHVVPTVAAQLWFHEPPDAIGLAGRALGTWAAPFSILCDMSPVVEHERWPTPAPASCAYLCGAWPLDAPTARAADGDAPARDLERARQALAAQLATHGGSLFATTATLTAPAGVTDPLDAQYVRVNVEPWDLADLSLPGADAVRLEATDSGMHNLALAGAWVRTTMNTTSFEAAVSSGLAAARALGAETRPILAESLLRRPSPRPVLPGRTLRVAKES
jgi:uncharacterized protein with NAD-binding domain and iron-sulfur cluster